MKFLDRVFALLCLLALSASIDAADRIFSDIERNQFLTQMDVRSAHYGDVSRKIWEMAELGYKEVKSSALLKSELKNEGFEIHEAVAGIPTAFVASWGSGSPVIGLLAEFDALPGLSQQDQPEKKPVTDGAPGHGCGHNLFGTASSFAAISVKDWMEKNKIQGTIRVYGTPAEEGGAAKVYMVREGLFKDCDIVISWHPGDENHASKESSLANISAKFRFRGKSAHAAGQPDQGRSALDAVMVMTHAVDLMREHVPTVTRLHYVITKGGQAPNVVPDFSEVFIYARHPQMHALDGIWQRVIRCAEAGALATDTQMEMEIIHSSYNVLPNDVLSEIVDRNLRAVGGIKYDEKEIEFAETLRRTLQLEDAPKEGSESVIQPIRSGTSNGSTDVGDVSWAVPVADLSVATWVPGTPAHSWQSTACSGHSIGRKGMTVAAKTMALTAIDLLLNPDHVTSAKQNFQERKGDHVYRSRIPADQKPPLNYRDSD
jgi:aminobenzoyl-glutamate utilization protein B